ncbi:redoxin domain-containing protein [bacterium]|nr:MAG: redoxin domain-containing protein [bacterium]
MRVVRKRAMFESRRRSARSWFPVFRLATYRGEKLGTAGPLSVLSLQAPMKTSPVPVGIGLTSMLLLASAFVFAVQEPRAKKPNPDQAPELTGGLWLNTEDGKPITFESRRGKPTLVAFWTFACSNCQANIAPYARLLAKYRPKGVEMISVHTPELDIERNPEEVKRHLDKFKIDYPVLIDNDHANWNRWKLKWWPTLYVLDGQGVVIHRWEGELNWNGAKGEVEVARLLDRLLDEKPPAQ